jgi:dTMP kinase
MVRIALRRGALIVFEGLDGAGKSTQAGLLCERLRKGGFDALTSKEPTDSEWGKKLKELIARGRGTVTPREELGWFIKDRQHHVEHTIKPALKSKKIVILDRYYFSTMAYQGCLGLNPQEIEKENQAFAPEPDLLFLIEISPRTGVRRIEQQRAQKADFFEREGYLREVGHLFGQLEKPFLHRLSGDEPISKLSDQAWDITTTYLRRNGFIEE